MNRDSLTLYIKSKIKQIVKKDSEILDQVVQDINVGINVFLMDAEEDLKEAVENKIATFFSSLAKEVYKEEKQK